MVIIASKSYHICVNIELPNYIKEIMDIFKENGYPCFLVGGAIRDYLLGLPVSDYDLTTPIDGHTIKKLFKGYYFINNNSERHKTYTLRYKQHSVEISTFKHIAGEPNTLESDIKHRDLNINSIVYDGENIIDYRNGIKDIENKIISMGDNSEQIIDEDPNRILRSIRFSATLGFEIDKKTKVSIIRNYEKLVNVSKERIVAEVNKIITSNKVSEMLLEYKDIFGFIFPELKPCIGFDQNNKWHKNDLYTHLVNVTQLTSPDTSTRYAALFHDIGKIKTVTQEYIKEEHRYINHYYGHSTVSKELARRILKEYKFSKHALKEILFLIENHDSIIQPTKKSVKKTLIKMGENIANPLLLLEKLIDLQKADRLDHTKNNPVDKEAIMLLAKEIIKEQEALQIKDLDIDGNDLIKFGYKGREIGDTLKELLQLVFTEELENKRKVLIDFIKNKNA